MAETNFKLNTPLSHSDLVSMTDSSMPYFLTKWESAEQNELKWAQAKSWTPEEEERIKAQNRMPYSFPLVPI